MKTEYEKMLCGEVYNAVDEGLLKDLNLCKDRCWEYNQIRPTLIKERNDKLHEILGRCDDDTFINQPFFCDYGKHIRVGRRFFANFNWTVLDEAMVTIGDDCFIGPNVSIYTACHSTEAKNDFRSMAIYVLFTSMADRQTSSPVVNSFFLYPMYSSLTVAKDERA